MRVFLRQVIYVMATLVKTKFPTKSLSRTAQPIDEELFLNVIHETRFVSIP